MSSSKRNVIWLEDLPRLNDVVRGRLELEEVDLHVCETIDELATLSREMMNAGIRPDGFVIDILVEGDGLDAFGIPEISTSGGMETGIAIVEHVILNLDDIKECELYQKWAAGSLILILSVQPTLESIYDYLANQERVTLITKEDENNGWLKRLDAWLSLVRAAGG